MPKPGRPRWRANPQQLGFFFNAVMEEEGKAAVGSAGLARVPVSPCVPPTHLHTTHHGIAAAEGAALGPSVRVAPAALPAPPAPPGTPGRAPLPPTPAPPPRSPHARPAPPASFLAPSGGSQTYKFNIWRQQPFRACATHVPSLFWCAITPPPAGHGFHPSFPIGGGDLGCACGLRCLIRAVRRFVRCFAS